MLRRTTATFASAAVLALALAGPAKADTPDLESYDAAATATALELTLGGLLGDPIALTVAGTGAAVASTPAASADGQALTTPLFSTEGAPVQSTGDVVTGDDCLNVALPPPINLLDIDITCVRTSAGVTDGDPTASSVSDEIEIEIVSAVAVGQVTDLLLKPLLDQALAGLAPVINPVVGGALDQLVADLLETLAVGDVLLRIEVAPTESHASGSTDGIVADASSGVARIVVLPGLGEVGLATISVAETGATVTRDAVTGEATIAPDFDVAAIETAGLASIVQNLIEDSAESLLGEILGAGLAGVLVQVLGLLDGVDEIIEDLVAGLGLDSLLGCGGPLAAVVCLDLGGVNELDDAELEARGMNFGPGTAGIEVTTLGLNVLDGTVNLALGQSTAAANATPATPVDLPDDPDDVPPPAEPRGPLPQTGAESALPITLALLAVGLAGSLLVRRSRTV